MLRKIRITLGLIFFVGITLLFLDFAGSLHAWLGWMAKIQFLPAMLAVNAGVVLGLIVLTLILGRVYCSVICPLGVMQDIISRLSGMGKKRRYRFSWSPAKTWLRVIVLAVFVVALVAGIGSIFALLAPYSSYGRIVSNLLAPVYQWVNNILAAMAEHAESYAFYHKDVWIKSLPTFIIAIVTFVVIAILSIRGGRTYCNTICPVGTILGYLSRFALVKIQIDAEKCNSCGLCSRRCKASCINGKEHSVDYTRCVACMDCIDTCAHGAISYSLIKPKASKAANEESLDGGRRAFMATGVALAATAALKAEEKRVDGGLAVIEDKKIPARGTKIVPFGAGSIKHFEQHCTACQLCVSVCPNGVLRPSTELSSMMQPEVSYEIGYCRPECTKCSDVCPAGAIKPISAAEKSAIQIGHAVWIKENCVVLTDEVECGNCGRHCPVGAITMIETDKEGLKIPAIDTERCIGCGACENLCPSRPFSAIYVEGHEVHRQV